MFFCRKNLRKNRLQRASFILSETIDDVNCISIRYNTRADIVECLTQICMTKDRAINFDVSRLFSKCLFIFLY